MRGYVCVSIKWGETTNRKVKMGEVDWNIHFRIIQSHKKF
jgi:hypothetical protein